jgi:hypothetical protein
MMLYFFLVPLLMASESDALRLYPGYVTRIGCEGRLLVSSVGNEALVRLEALPKELGCGVLVKPLAASGRTNLILETSAGTIERVLSVERAGGMPRARELRYGLRAGGGAG